jgi:hypothetical protein
VDTSTDENNCGACSHAGTTGTPTCAASICQPTCAANFADCNKPAAPAADDGCDANLTTSASSCGACGHTCYLGACNGTCQPWKVVDAPNTSVPALLATDGTYVVWLDTGLTSIRQAKFDKTGILTLSTDATAFASADQPIEAPISMGGGIVVVATSGGVYEAVVNTANTKSTRLAFNTPAGSGLSALGLDPTGKHLGLAGSSTSPQGTRIYDCQIANLTCIPVGGVFVGGVYGAAANASAYYFMNAQAGSVQDFTFGTTTLKTLQAKLPSPDSSCSIRRGRTGLPVATERS